MKLFKSYYRLNTRVNFFTQRVINNWNNLPNEVVSANSIESFQRVTNSQKWVYGFRNL